MHITIPFILPLFHYAQSQIHVHFISIIIMMYSISFLHECTWCVLFLNIDYFYVTALKVIHQIKKIRIASFSSFFSFSFAFLLFIPNEFSFVQTLTIKYSLHKHQQKLFKVFDIIFCIVLSKQIHFGVHTMKGILNASMIFSFLQFILRNHNFNHLY